MIVDDMAGLLRELGLDYIKDRRLEVWASCPGHHDSGDSWSINKQTGLHSCFACPTKGDIYGLILKFRPNYDMRMAQALVEKYGVTLMDSNELAELIEDPYKPDLPLAFNPLLRYRKFAEVPELALTGRYLTREGINHYGVRWKDPDTWILPIKAPSGAVLGWQEKGAALGAMSRTLPVGIKKSATLFGAEHLPEDLVVLVESPLDAVRLWDLGYGAVASYGAAVSDAQMRLLVGGAQDVILCLDNDDAGKKWTWDILTKRKTNWGARLRLRVAEYSTEAKDIGEMQDEEVVETLINSSFVLDYLRENKRPEDSVQGRVETVSNSGRRTNDREKKAPRRTTNGPGKGAAFRGASTNTYGMGSHRKLKGR